MQRTLRADIADADKGDIGFSRQRFDDPVEPVIAPLRTFGLVIGDQRGGQQEVLAARPLGNMQRDVIAVR